ncbi:MAG: T9SS type A sorting domain-containing protein [Saprospiraceae bacterium]|nr:T9SS type A sorting domain-containing protein [Saprospiraceae bacterium]
MKLLLIVLLFSTFCYGQQTIYDTIYHAGIQRDYILYIPANYTPTVSYPLLINYHGRTSTAHSQMWFADFRPIADTAGFIIVHPQGALDTNNITHFNVGFGGSNVDDLGFSESLIDTISNDYNINQNKIYCTGMSNGGYMSYHMACRLNHKIAAIASVTGSMSNYTINNCFLDHPTPVLQIHGTNDLTVPYNGSNFSQPIDSVIQFWVSQNNCNTIPSTSTFPDIVTSDGSTVDYFVYNNGNCNSNVELMKVVGGAHNWPGSPFGSAGTNYDINACKEIWDFLSKYNLNDLKCNTNPIFEKQNATLEIKIFPIPTNAFIYIEHNSNKCVEYEIISPLGKIVKTGNLNTSLTSINLRDLFPGIYYLKTSGMFFSIVVY